MMGRASIWTAAHWRAGVYAFKGERVVCERGHIIGEITRDLRVGEITRGDEVSGISVSIGEFFHACECGAWFTVDSERDGVGGFIFENGGLRA